VEVEGDAGTLTEVRGTEKGQQENSETQAVGHDSRFMTSANIRRTPADVP